MHRAACGGGLVRLVLDLGLARDAGEAEEQVRHQLECSEAHATALVKQARLELRQEQLDGARRVVDDHHAAGADRRVAHALDIVRDARDDRRDNAAEVRNKTRAKGRRQVDEQRKVSLADVRRAGLRVLNDRRKQALHALHAKTSKHLGEALRSAVAVDARRVRLEHVQQ